MGNQAAKVRVLLEYKPEYRNPIQVKAGEKVEVGREDDKYPGWFWCRAADGREGWVPFELLARQGTENIVTENYSAKELSVQSGEELDIQEIRHDWVLSRNAQGEVGWVPQSHVDLERETVSGK